MSLLKVRGLVKSYGRRRVVDGVDFEVDPGEIVGLLGPNGAGKTTTFRMTCGMIDPDAGTVTLAGKDVTNWPMYRRANEGGMGYLAQESSVFRKLSVQKNLLGVMEMLGMDRTHAQSPLRRAARAVRHHEAPPQRRRCRSPAASGGGWRSPAALVSDPQIILLDEPFTGIDPVTIDSIQGIIRDLRDRGISILITDHQVRETLEITDRSYVIRGGQVLCHGRPREVLNNPEARKYYFGEGMDVEPARGGVIFDCTGSFFSWTGWYNWAEPFWSTPCPYLLTCRAESKSNFKSHLAILGKLPSSRCWRMRTVVVRSASAG